MVDIRNPLSCDEAMAKLIAIFSKNRDPSGRFLQSVYDLIKSVYERQPDFVCMRYVNKLPGGKKVPLTMPFLQYRLNMAGIMAENLNANADIVLSALLGPALKLKLLYRSNIRTPEGEQAYERVSARLQDVSNIGSDAVKKCDEIDLLLFDMAIENEFNNLCKKLHKKRRPQIAYIKQAYKIAESAHSGVYRQSGEPYIIHPIMVADILADAGAESDIISAALLHDVLEDSDVTVSVIDAINPQISRYVQAVTSVEKEYEEYKLQKGALGEDYDEQSKEDLDRQSINKLIRMATEDESMIFAFYIKAADRLHNLRTIDGMPVDKIRSKLNETEEFYLPLFRRFGLHDFVDAIEDQIWRVSNLRTCLYEEVGSIYRRILSTNEKNIEATQSLLDGIVNREIQRYCEGLYVQAYTAEITMKHYYPYQVFRQVKQLPVDQRAKSISKKTTPACYFNIVVDATGLNDLILYSKIFVKAFNQKSTDECLSPEERCVITDFAIEPINPRQPERKRFMLTVEDAFYTKCVIYIYNQEDYFIYSNGSEKGIYIPEKLDQDDLDEMEGTIKVYCPDNAQIELPKGSTALDFAFRIHIELGMYALKASINGSTPSEKQLYAILTEDDKVEIEYDAEMAENYGGKKYEGAHVKIDWLNHVKTNQARRLITRWLRERYECGA